MGKAVGYEAKQANRARLKHSRRFYWGRDLSKEPVQLSKVVDTKKPCSCLMCGNARKHAGPTRQEMRFNSQSEEEQ